MINKDLSVEFLGVHFENPFCLSSSPVGNCYDMCKKAYDCGWGGVVFKTIGPKHFLIDEVSPRFDALTKEATPFVGFKNMEQIAEHSLEENLADLRRLKAEYPHKVLIASIMGTNEEDWTELARLVEEAGADMIEMNLSCPQMTSHAMGSDVGANPELCKKYCAAVKRGSKLPMLAKMTPNITDMVPVAKACLEGGADGIAAINTIKSIVNLDLQRYIGLPIINGKSSISGYSGKAVKPVALRFIQQLRSGIKDLPISGIGGIETWEDAAEFILLGATTLQVTTSIMQYGYRVVEDMKNGLMHYMEEQGVDRLRHRFELVNRSEAAMPFGLGFHTAFRLPEVEEAFVEIPFREEGCWAVHPERRLPTGELRPWSGEELALFRGERPAGKGAVAAMFPLPPGAAGHRAELRRNGRRIVYEFDLQYRHLACWNGGGGAGFFCIEPMSWMTDAPNLPLPAPVSGFSLLPPESERTFCCTLRVEDAV